MSNFIETCQKDRKVKQLTAYWIEIKEAENECKERRLEIEEKIIKLTSINKMSNNTVKLPNNITVSTKINRKWDHDFLLDNIDKINALSKYESPFKMQFKEIKKNMEHLQFSDKELYEHFQQGVIETASKPGFKVAKKEKGEIK